MAFRHILDSDVDRLTAMAIQGVNAFISLYEDERGEIEATGPVNRAAMRAPAKASKRTASRPAKPAKNPPRRRL